MTFVLLIGPPAVGKMAVGLALEARTGLKLFHNHVSIELALKFFDHGSPPFSRLVSEIRRQVLEGVAEATVAAGSASPERPAGGLILTLVIDFDDPRDLANAQAYADIFAARGHRVIVVELEATLDERLRRNATPLRLAEKSSKRDVAASEARLLAASRGHRLNSARELDDHPGYLRLDNTHRTPEDVAQAICDHFGL